MLLVVTVACEAWSQSGFLLGAEWLNNPSCTNIEYYDPSDANGEITF